MFESISDEPKYNTRAVVRRTGVPADTFRAWERRYGVPSPMRTDGNQRLYSERDVRKITWLREQTAMGLTISQAILLMRSEKEEPPIVTPPQHQPVDRRIAEILSGNRILVSDRLASVRKKIMDAFCNLDGQTAEAVLDETYTWADLEVICVDLLYNAVIEIESNPKMNSRLSAVLPFAHAFVQRKFASLFNLPGASNDRGPILAAAVEDEERDLTLLLSAYFLAAAGYRVVYLGNDVSFEGLLAAIRTVRPAVLSLAASRDQTADTLQDWVDRLHRHRDESNVPIGRIPICYSGRIFLQQPERRERINGTFLGRGAQDSVSVVGSLLPPSPNIN
jgi:DNA-binding transcriptional MerR regulator